jgi:diketogulonate reductase-like aldo/keto reductase
MYDTGFLFSQCKATDKFFGNHIRLGKIKPGTKKTRSIMKKTRESTAKLNNGVEIPYLGLGTWQSRGENCTHAVAFALTHGYDLVDSAQAYDNERQVGDGWKASGRQRDEIFITTKSRNSNQGYGSTKTSFEKSLEDLQTDYVDLLLIHWPDIKDFSRTVETWRALVELQEEGVCRSIGVSNFTIDLLEKLLDEIEVVPQANQVEFHPFLYQQALLTYCREHHIQIEAYSPIARAKFLDNDVLQDIAHKHHKTEAQVMLAWGVHHDLVVIPKSVHEDRILENADIFFDLDEEDQQALDDLGPEHRLVKGFWSPKSW